MEEHLSIWINGTNTIFSVNHVSQYTDVDGRNVIIDTTNPWNISVNVNNNNGSYRFVARWYIN